MQCGERESTNIGSEAVIDMLANKSFNFPFCLALGVHQMLCGEEFLHRQVSKTKRGLRRVIQWSLWSSGNL